MSVPSYRREENKLEVLNIATDVFKMIVQLSKNEKVIAKKNFKIIAEPMLKHIREITYNISLANNTYAKDKDQLVLRQKFQERAKILIIMLIVDVQFAIELSYDTDAILKFDNLLIKLDELKTKHVKWLKSTQKLLSNLVHDQ